MIDAKGVTAHALKLTADLENVQETGKP